MRLSEKAKMQLKIFEGLRLEKYNDIGGVATIGYGHTGSHLPSKITKEEAENYLNLDLEKFEKHVNQYSKDYGYSFNQNQFDALVLFSFNIGGINGLTNYGKRSKKEIANKMLEYCNVNHKPVQGLISRRKFEHDLFLLPCENVSRETLTDDSMNTYQDFDVIFPYIKKTYRLRTQPIISESNIYKVVTQDEPCKIVGKTNNFLFVQMIDGKEYFVHKDGIIWK